MLVVSDTSPITSLIQIGRVDLLRDLFGTVCIPRAVHDELGAFHSSIPTFLQVRDVQDLTRVQSLLAELDLGEAEAIVLAAESGADYLLVDERRGRMVAARSGISIIGLLGVLLLARRQNRLKSIKDCLVDLRDKAGFYVSDEVMQRILAAAGE